MRIINSARKHGMSDDDEVLIHAMKARAKYLDLLP